MKVNSTGLEGVFLIDASYSYDIRGGFVKTYNEEIFHQSGLCPNFKESYYSISNENVIRGMHFQLPPYAHGKLVYVAKGGVLDVILDLRKSSSSYGKTISIALCDRSHKAIYIPEGCAHGFKSMENDTIMVYSVTMGYHKEADFGVRYDSIGFDWAVPCPIVSERDNALIRLEEYKVNNPF